MKLPREIKGKNKIRDAAIVLEFKRTRAHYHVIAKKFGLTEMRISQILRDNHTFIATDKAWEKERRITRLERWLNDPKYAYTQKDPADLLAQLKNEIEGDKSQDQNSKNTNIILIRVDGNKTQNVAGQIHIQPDEISGNVQLLGNGQINESDFPCHAIQRAYS